jgi:outer membrane protein OmpA-like peptidoglycan-associated protein
LKANPHIARVRVEGHTDNQGDDASNMDLSQRRANSVVAFLVKEAIDPARLKAVGYGETVPVDDNKKAKGRENNRRVEFTIVNDEPMQPDDAIQTPEINTVKPDSTPDAGTR